MKKSDRSTFEITQLAQMIVNNPDLEPIERYGESPIFRGFSNVGQEHAFLAEQVEDFGDTEFQSVGIITRTQAEADQLYEKLSAVGEVHLLNAESKFFQTGIVISTAYLAKGLEFDKVLIPHCKAGNYRSAIDRHMLYVAVTRAMHSLALTFSGDVSDLVAPAAEIFSQKAS